MAATLLGPLTQAFFTKKPESVAPPGIFEKKASVAIPVLFLIVLLLMKGSKPPTFKPMPAWRVIMGVITAMYIAAFWLPAEAMHIFFTVPAEPHELIPDNKLCSPVAVEPTTIAHVRL